MARKTNTITIAEYEKDKDGKATTVLKQDYRDNGKTFLITEMPSDQGERWAIRALLALSNAGVNLPDGALQSGFAGFASVGLEALGKLDYLVVEPLLDEMFDCVQFVAGPGIPARALINGPGGDIEEIKTRVMLRMEVFKLHINFSTAAKTQTTA